MRRQTTSEKQNTLSFRIGEERIVLEINDDHLLFNDPSGSPLIEAKANGEIFIRGERVSHPNKEIYAAFTLWLDEVSNSEVPGTDKQVQLEGPAVSLPDIFGDPPD